MKNTCETIPVTPVGHHGRMPTFQAKIGTLSSTCIVVKRTRKFYVGQAIEFAELSDLSGMCVGVAPRWRHGIVWKIEDDRLFIDL